MKIPNDKLILDTLYCDIPRGMELLMGNYTGLVWKVISFYLNNPEDIKECVNDTFTEFYFCKEQYDTKKSSLPVYLTAIAKHLAISRYRNERRYKTEAFPSAPAVIDRRLELAEAKSDLAKAMSSLKPDELQIIRMKYYGGMTIQEIADSLHLPYETVKKRHQRSIGKLRHSLFLVLLLLLILMLTACTYGILRHYDIIPSIWEWDLFSLLQEIDGPDVPDKDPVRPQDLRITFPDISDMLDIPGIIDTMTDHTDTAAEQPTENTVISQQPEHTASGVIPEEYTYIPDIGIKTDPTFKAYKLEESVSVEDDETKVTIEGASFLNGTLLLSMTLQSKTIPWQSTGEGRGTENIFLCVNGVRLDMNDSVTSLDRYTDYYESTTDVFSPDSVDQERIELSIECYGFSLPFTLVSTTEESIADKYAYQMEEFGGIMAIPRLENGSLIVAIYPLDVGEFRTFPGLVYELRDTSFYYSDDRVIVVDTNGNPMITATDANGDTLIGRCIRYHPFGNETHFDWDFGEAAPGQYTLHIPCVCQTLAAPLDISVPLDLKERTWEDTAIKIPGGSMRIESISEPEYTPLDSITDPIGGNMGNYNDLHWKMTMSYTPDDDKHSFQGIGAYVEYPCLQPTPYIDCYERFPETTYDNDYRTFVLEVKANSSLMDISSARLKFNEAIWGIPKTYYRWNQSFDLTFTVE